MAYHHHDCIWWSGQGCPWFLKWISVRWCFSLVVLGRFWPVAKLVAFQPVDLLLLTKILKSISGDGSSSLSFLASSSLEVVAKRNRKNGSRWLSAKLNTGRPSPRRGGALAQCQGQRTWPTATNIVAGRLSRGRLYRHARDLDRLY